MKLFYVGIDRPLSRTYIVRLEDKDVDRASKLKGKKLVEFLRKAAVGGWGLYSCHQGDEDDNTAEPIGEERVRDKLENW